MGGWTNAVRLVYFLFYGYFLVLFFKFVSFSGGDHSVPLVQITE